MKLKFVCDCTYDNKPFAKTGDIREIDDKGGHASRWIRRGFAIDITHQEPLPKIPAKVSKSKKETAPEVKKEETALEISETVAIDL